MDNNNAILAGPLDNLGEKLGRCAGTRRVVRIVQVEQFGTACNVLRDRVEIRQKSILFFSSTL